MSSDAMNRKEQPDKKQEIRNRVNALRAHMRERGICIYVIPSADFHQSEYVGEHFKARAFMTGFSGSAGTAVVTLDRAGLWTDGRYFLQAEEQLRDTPYELMRMGEEGVPDIEAFLEEELPQGGKIGFDGRVISVAQGNAFAQIAAAKDGKLVYDVDLANEIWTDRPQLPQEKAFFLEEKYSGESISGKLTRVREAMKDCEADVHVLTALDDICWLFNIRGNDIAYSPLVLSYALIERSSAKLYVDEKKLDECICQELDKNQVEVRPYEEIYEAVKRLESKVLLDPSRLNYALYSLISPVCKKVEAINPTQLLKAVKNEVEIANIRRAHIKDGVAVTKFLYWLKGQLEEKKQELTKNPLQHMAADSVSLSEISVSDKLEDFRAQQEGFLSPSFAPISAYREHAAIVHYSAAPETNVALKPEGLLLMDTGGHYYEGTTDITRTIALGELTSQEREHFTIVAISMLTLANTKFLHGCDGVNLDAIARAPFWKRGLNFNHGTGHGVGYLMNVHEGPNAFRWQRKSGSDVFSLEAGMITTDEPGLYIAGSHGIRTENELLTVKGEKNEYGQFLEFEYLTFVPIDLDAIDVKLMSAEEIAMLNDYHSQVYEKISPYLTVDERTWLQEATRAV